MTEPKSPRRPRPEPPGIPGPPLLPRPPAPQPSRPEATAPQQAPASRGVAGADEGRAPRKLIRPALPAAAPPRGSGQVGGRRREAPSETTGAEASLLSKLASTGAQVTVVLDTGDSYTGQIEWADRSCLKLRRRDAPPVLVFRHALVSLEAESSGRRRG